MSVAGMNVLAALCLDDLWFLDVVRIEGKILLRRFRGRCLAFFAVFRAAFGLVSVFAGAGAVSFFAGAVSET